MDELQLLDQQLEDRYFRALLAFPKLLELTVSELEESNFSSNVKAKLYRAFSFYWQQFQSAPTRDMLEMTVRELFPGEQGQDVHLYLERVVSIPAPEWAWVVTKINDFIRKIAMHKRLYEAADMLRDGRTTEAEHLLADTIRNAGIATHSTTSDLELTTAELRDLASEDQSFCFPSRIYALDEAIQGFYRKELLVLMAPLNVGKSWFATHSAKEALISGKHVLYFTLEMSKERVLQRILQSISGAVVPLTDTELRRTTQLWERDRTKRTDVEVPTLLDTQKVAFQLKLLRDYQGVLHIKSYPSGIATVPQLERDVSLFDVTFDHPPDVIIVDGLSDLSFSGSGGTQHRHGLTQLTRELRRIAIDNNAAVLTTHQSNRASIQAEVVDIEHSGESLGIMQVADVALSLSQSRKERKQDTMRMLVMRARNKEKGRVLKLWQALGMGQFALHSEEVVESKAEGQHVRQRSPLASVTTSGRRRTL